MGETRFRVDELGTVVDVVPYEGGRAGNGKGGPPRSGRKKRVKLSCGCADLCKDAVEALDAGTPRSWVEKRTIVSARLEVGYPRATYLCIVDRLPGGSAARDTGRSIRRKGCRGRSDRTST